MTQYYIKVKLYLEANSKTWEAEQDKIRLQDDGHGAFIRTWNVNGLAKPTEEQIASYEASAVVEEENKVVISTRKTAYGPWDKQLEEIYDNGIDSWKTRIAKIKSDNPKS